MCMDNKKYLQIAALVVLAAIALFVIKRKPQTSPQATDFESCSSAGGQILFTEPAQCRINGQTFTEVLNQEPEVAVDQPQYGALVSSPLQVSGRARGFWFFEANIPVTLKDQNGQVLAQKGFHATSDWMTEDFVPFQGTLEFTTPTTDFGVLVIQKDNPSGDPKFDAAFAIPVRFK